MRKTDYEILLGVVMLMMGGLFLSCTPSIEGELILLVDDLEHESWFSHSPCWSFDGSKVFFLSHWDENVPEYRIWSFDLSDKTIRLVSNNEDEIIWMDVSHQRDICITSSIGTLETLQLYDLEHFTRIGHIYCLAQDPKFSLESDSIFFYTDNANIWKFNLADSSDEKVWTKGTGLAFAPGPGDTLFARGDTVYNINTGEAIPIGIGGDDIYNINWNPADAGELLISTGTKGKLYIFDLMNRELKRLEINEVQVSILSDAKYSPDGDKILFSCAIGSDVQKDQIWLFIPLD